MKPISGGYSQTEHQHYQWQVNLNIRTRRTEVSVKLADISRNRGRCESERSLFPGASLKHSTSIISSKSTSEQDELKSPSTN